jgi:hypothetical protein
MFGLVVFLICCSNLIAKDAPLVQVISVKGEVVGKHLRISVEPGAIATKGISIYSEPSHTFLLMVVDKSFSKQDSGKAWIKQNTKLKGPAALVTTDLPSGKPSVQVPARPETDDRIAVWVNGNWPGDLEEERLIADGAVGPGAFAFSTAVRTSGDPEHCCQGGP